MDTLVRWRGGGGATQSDLCDQIENETRAIAGEAKALAAEQSQRLKTRASSAAQRLDQWTSDVQNKLLAMVQRPRFWLGAVGLWGWLALMSAVGGGSEGFLTVLFFPLMAGLVILSIGFALFIMLWMVGIALTPLVVVGIVGHEVVRSIHPDQPKCTKCGLHEIFLDTKCASCLIARLGAIAEGLKSYKEAQAPVVRLADELGLDSQKAAVERGIVAREAAGADTLRVFAREATRRQFEREWGSPVAWASSSGVAVDSYQSPLDEASLLTVKRLRDEFGYDIAQIRLLEIQRRDGGKTAGERFAIGAPISWQSVAWPNIDVSGTLAV